MSTADWVVLGIVAVTGIYGFSHGLVRGVFSLLGFALGAWAGAVLAPQILSDENSAYAPLVALGGALIGGFVLQALAGALGSMLRGGISAVPGLGPLDRAAGLLAGVLAGFALAWAIGAVLLYLPGQERLRHEAQASSILTRINQEFPPERLIDTLGRVDPLGALIGPLATVDPPKPGIVADADVRAASKEVVRVTGNACGLGVEGSGWIAAPELVVTAAHVVAGVDRPRVDRGAGGGLAGKVVVFDVKNDLALLRVAGLEGSGLVTANPQSGDPVAIVGYPENGPLALVPARLGATGKIVSSDAYGRTPRLRVVTTARGLVLAGNSGSPAIDGAGRVRMMVFARREGGDGGYGVPAAVLQQAVSSAGTEALRSTPCAGP